MQSCIMLNFPVLLILIARILDRNVVVGLISQMLGFRSFKNIYLWILLERKATLKFNDIRILIY